MRHRMGAKAAIYSWLVVVWWSMVWLVDEWILLALSSAAKDIVFRRSDLSASIRPCMVILAHVGRVQKNFLPSKRNMDDIRLNNQDSDT